ncbi:hypothetical protein PVAND_012628 [Polypedilum vanderplanki]|uniref:Lipoprotein n=1 Tax=Polypedilum vanderplanki TaxID=319348 RepID=A0A9J6CP03_POLVA|nr:hypothetical protein PVAND_012628 [Polypedilum vanderplanki]
MFFKKSLWLLVLVAVVSCKNVPQYDNQFTNAKMNCFIKHLKNEKLLRDNFEEFPSQNNFNVSSCEKYVTAVEDFYYQRVKNGSSFSVETPDFQDILQHQGDCIEKNLRDENYGDLILKSLVYDALKPLTADLSLERNQTVTRLQNALSKAISDCTFTALYDQYIEIRRHNYCARKYVVENDIMGLRHFNLTLNPFHIDVKEVNCKNIIEGLVDDIASDDNAINKMDALQLLSHEWAVIFLTEINVTKEEREEEEKKYEEELHNIPIV